MAQADGQGSVTFSDPARPIGRFWDTACSSQMQDGQERGKESEAGTEIPDRLRDWMETGSRRQLNRTRANRDREAREEEYRPIRAEPLVCCLFGVYPFSKRVFD